MSSDPSSLDNDLLEAALWESEHSPERARADRETIISAIEAEACSPTMIAAQSRWLSTVDEEAQPMASLIHDPMISKLCRAAGIDPAQLESDLCGFSLTGKITGPGKRETFSAEPTTSRAELESNIEITNNETLRTLHRDKNEDILMRDMLKDFDNHRMTRPKHISMVDIQKCLLARRFGVEQGVRANGDLKVRSCDDETANGSNDTAAATEKVAHDHIDALALLVLFS